MIDRKHWKSMMGLTVLTIAAFALVMTMLTGCRHPGHGNVAPEKIAERVIGKISSELELNEGQKQYLEKVKQELLARLISIRPYIFPYNIMDSGFHRNDVIPTKVGIQKIIDEYLSGHTIADCTHRYRNNDTDATRTDHENG